MAIDEIKTDGNVTNNYPGASSHTTIFLVAFLFMAALAVGEVYSIKQIDSVRDSMTAAQAKQRAELEDQLASKVATVENSSAQALEAMKTELDNTAARA